MHTLHITHIHTHTGERRSGSFLRSPESITSPNGQDLHSRIRAWGSVGELFADDRVYAHSPAKEDNNDRNRSCVVSGWTWSLPGKYTRRLFMAIGMILLSAVRAVFVFMYSVCMYFVVYVCLCMYVCMYVCVCVFEA